ncbi:ParB/RepB/Spo0J family partition protein [Granulicella arctica]|uniref:ParB/RepB/Spo0J family partition protein n=1 Tax=Granulicella arctica TaxID=940613 RepID=UPI0021E024CB|nr:ParB/RepB/Spo0J family partition protein [Granulicella arctica]
MHTAAIAESGYRNLPLSMLDESSTNPRRTFEPTKLVELAQSLTIHGLIQPITVRPKGERFEVVAGARRFRAAQIADLADVPTRILELSDEQTIEIQIVENAQRQDVHPYEEATGYQRLLDFPGYDVAALASKCGKSQSHIYARLSLLQLIPDVADAFQQERITASHANLIARLTPEQQAEAFKNCFRKDWQDKEGHLLPAKHLAAWIDTNLYLALAEAPFPTDDPTLNAEAGACLTCPRRTGFNTQLFADVEADHCLDAACYGSKVAAVIAREIAANPGLVQISTEWRPANERSAGQLLPNDYRRVQTPKEGSGEATQPVCSHATTAIITYGDSIGKRLPICAAQECPVHRPRHTVTPAPDFEQRQQEALCEREERQQQRDKREKALRALILRFPSTATEQQMRFLLKALVIGDLENSLERVAARLDDDQTVNMASDDVCAEVIDSLMPSSLMGFLAELALGSHVDVPQPEERDLLKEALSLFTAPKPILPLLPPKATNKRALKIPTKKSSRPKA